MRALHQQNLLVPGRGGAQPDLFDVKSQELLTSKLPCRGDMKQVSTAAPYSVMAFIVWSAMTRCPNTLVSRAARSGIGRLTGFGWGNGINRATACRLMVMATSSPA